MYHFHIHYGYVPPVAGDLCLCVQGLLTSHRAWTYVVMSRWSELPKQRKQQQNTVLQTYFDSSNLDKVILFSTRQGQGSSLISTP